MILKNLKSEYEKKGFVVYKNLISKKNLNDMKKSLGAFTKIYKAKQMFKRHTENKQMSLNGRKTYKKKIYIYIYIL